MLWLAVSPLYGRSWVHTKYYKIAASLLKHTALRTKTCWLRNRIMCPSGTTYLPVHYKLRTCLPIDCWFNEPVLFYPQTIQWVGTITKECWSIIIISSNVNCSCTILPTDYSVSWYYYQRMLVYYHHLFECKLFYPLYRWKIAYLALNNNQSLTSLIDCIILWTCHMLEFA